MIKDLTLIAKILNDSLLNAYEEGLIQPDSEGNLSPSSLFPFDVSEVVGVHTHKLGFGDGVFFRLENGRVFDSRGVEQDPTPSLYDTVEN